MSRVKRRITTVDFLSEVYYNILEDPNLTILQVLPYSYSHTLSDTLLEKVMIVYKDES